ncbi:MAG: hypothetical protein IJZ53_03270 [Tyzzerella sp.]|nr:hypothetical protein [Tyzzerella sp.]
MKKFISILLSVMLVLAMVGCGGGETKEKDEPKDPKVLLEEATEKMQGIEAMDFSMLMDMNMEMAGEEIAMEMEMGVQVQDQGKETMKMAMPMTMKMPSQGVTMEMNMYYTEGYYYMDMLGMKMKTPMDVAEMMEGVEEGTSAADISTEGMTELELEEKEDSYVISFVGDTEKMLAYSEAAMASMQSMSGLEGAEVTLDEIKGTITIDKEGYITEQVVDMAMTMTVEGEAVATTMTMTLTYNSIGEDVVVELPDLTEYQETTTTE